MVFSNRSFATRPFRNRSFPNRTFQKPTGLTFVSVQSGNWSNPSTWNVLIANGSLQATSYIPDLTNDVFVQAAHTVTCTPNQSCKTLWLNATQDVIRINTGVFKLLVYGTMNSYDGTYLAPSFNAANAGIAAWISGTISFKGSYSRNIFGPGQSLSANSRSAGWTYEVDFDPGAVAFNNSAVVRCGFLTVKSGTLSILPINTSSFQIRIAGFDYTPQPGDGTNAGNVLVKTGATLIFNGGLIKNTPTSAKNGLQDLTVEAGAFLVAASSAPLIPTITYSLLGEVWYNQSFAQNWISRGTNVDSVSIIQYATVLIDGTNAKTLVNNVTINSQLAMGASGATLALGAFALSYGSNASLRIKSSRIRGSELPALSSGSSICKDLVVDPGVVYDLNGGIVNIRGILTGGGTTSNGILNQNQP